MMVDDVLQLAVDLVNAQYLLLGHLNLGKPDRRRRICAI